MSEARVAALDEVTPGQPMLVDAHGVRVVLSRAGDQVYACGDVCTHRGGPLSAPRRTATDGGSAASAGAILRPTDKDESRGDTAAAAHNERVGSI